MKREKVKLYLIQLFNRIKNNIVVFIKFLDNYSNLLVAVGTLSLALFTVSHIRATRRMSEETKRLTDFSIQQFKIKSYPTLVITFEDIKYVTDRLFQKISFWNKGEITAFNFSLLPVAVFNVNNRIGYVPIRFVSIENGQKIVVNHERKIWRDSGCVYHTEIPFIEPKNIDNIETLMLLFKYRVPYDTTYHYEVQTFTLKKDFTKQDNERYMIWQQDSADKRDLIFKKYLDITEGWPSFVKIFLKDFKNSS